jgi:chromosome segregation ATPase
MKKIPMNNIRRILAILVILATALAVFGCATTDDPRQGGLFGYNPDAYQQRIAEREATLATLKKEDAAQRKRTVQLEQDQRRQQSEKDAANHRLAEMDRQIGVIEKKISATRRQTSAQQREYENINARLHQVKREMAGAASSDDAAKRKEIERLNAEIDRLLLEADALSNL